MLIDHQTLLDYKRQIAAFDDAAKWKLIERIDDLDDEVLEATVNALGLPAPDALTGSGLRAMAVPEKMKLNKFGETVKQIVGTCMCYSSKVATFIYERNRTDLDFAETLRTYFCQLYANLRHEGFLGDDLFVAMQFYIRDKVKCEGQLAVATAILVHLFLVCDVFEKSGEPYEVRMKKEATHDPSE